MKDYERKIRNDLEIARRHVAESEKALEQLRWKVTYLSGLLNGEDDGGDEDDPVSAAPIMELGAKPYAGMTNIRATEEVLRRSGKPMKLKDIVRTAIAGGLAAPDQFDQRRANIASILARASKDEEHPKFRKISRGVFELAKGS